MATVQITKENYQALVEQPGTIALLDFWAVWCGPCKMIAPIVEQIADEREDVLMGKVNVDEDMELAAKFGITSIPTLVVLKDGKAVATAVGYRPKADIEKLLNV